jgi:hypothetical protein
VSFLRLRILRIFWQKFLQFFIWYRCAAHGNYLVAKYFISTVWVKFNFKIFTDRAFDVVLICQIKQSHHKLISIKNNRLVKWSARANPLPAIRLLVHPNISF